MYKRKLHKEISSGLLVLIVAFSLTGCGSSRDALEISDTESAQAEGISQETATATPREKLPSFCMDTGAVILKPVS